MAIALGGWDESRDDEATGSLENNFAAELPVRCKMLVKAWLKPATKSYFPPKV
jgi:hypothetical protein